MPAPQYDDQRYVSEDGTGQKSRGSRQYPVSHYNARYERFEIDPPSLQARQDDMRGKKVTFCMSGDRDCKGLDLCINSKIRTFGSLLAELDKHPKIKPKGGVRYIFRKDENRFAKVEDLTEIQSGDLYVVSDRPTIDKTINYGIFPSGPSPTKSLHRSPPPRRSQKTTAPIRRSVSRKNNTIVIMNKERMSTYKLNPNTTQLFEQVLDDIGDMLKLSAYKPLSMHSVIPCDYARIDSFTKLNSQLHATELRSSGKETPKFLIVKYGEDPEDALSEKMRKAYEKKGLIKTNEDRYADEMEGDNGYDQGENDGAPEPQNYSKRVQKHRDVSPPKRMDESNAARKGHRNRSYEQGSSPDEPQATHRGPRRMISKSQSKESVETKGTSHTPRQNGFANKTQSKRQAPQGRVEDTSSDSQVNQEDDTESDDDFPEPRVVEQRKPKARVETPEC